MLQALVPKPHPWTLCISFNTCTYLSHAEAERDKRKHKAPTPNFHNFQPALQTIYVLDDDLLLRETLP